MPAKIKHIQETYGFNVSIGLIKAPTITKTGPTTFSVSAGGVARFCDNYSNPLLPDWHDVKIPAQTDVTAIYPGTGAPVTFLKIDKDRVVSQSVLGAIPSERRRKVVYGYLEHINSSQIENYGALTSGNPNAGLAGDIMFALSSVKIQGGDILPHGTDMRIKIEGGQALFGGINILNSYETQNYLSWNALSLVTTILYTFRLSGGGFGFHEVTSPAVIVPNKWDDGTATSWATLPSVPSGNWSMQRCFLVADPRTGALKLIIQLPQFTHSTYTNAINFCGIEPFIVNPQAYLGMHVTDIYLKESATNLSLGLGSLPTPDALFRQRLKNEIGY